MTWDEAFEYVQILNDQQFAGFFDWRLPTSKELRSIVYLKSSSNRVRPITLIYLNTLMTFAKAL